MVKMHCLLIWPQFPKTFWSFEAVLELAGRKVLVPPLALTTVAAMLPDTWEFKLVDRNLRSVTESEWEWAHIVMFSGMIVHRQDMIEQIRLAHQHGKPVVVGGPYATSCPEELQAVDVDYLVLDEAEITLPLFLEALERGDTNGVFHANGEKPDVTSTPIPRFDLYDLNAYDTMALQYSRGCPFLCEFCDIITLYGRRPRTKTPKQVLAELDYLYKLGWRRGILIVDDNFIGNKKNAKQMLRELQKWQQQHGYPFPFMTEASVDLASDKELMELMVACNFDSVFLGIETPDEESLNQTRKYQNVRNSLIEGVESIIKHGLRPMGGFIIGFDGEKKHAGQRIVQFVEQSDIPTANFSMLQALPNTALWDRLKKEGRLLKYKSDINQTSMTNFIPQRPIREIAREYVEAFADIYDPITYIDRVYRCFLKLGRPVKFNRRKIILPSLEEIRALTIIIWRQGILRKTRWKFWHHSVHLLISKPSVLPHYLSVSAQYEHFVDFKNVVRSEIKVQLDEIPDSENDIMSAEYIA